MTNQLGTVRQSPGEKSLILEPSHIRAAVFPTGAFMSEPEVVHWSGEDTLLVPLGLLHHREPLNCIKISALQGDDLERNTESTSAADILMMF